ncbi:ABC transporter permease, partial [Paenibacillus sepulcri]|nr:ABC transporter permease [Paenibacillus sepulcri]
VQLLFLAAILAAALYHGIEAEVPWSMLLRCVIGGWVACLPLAAVQLGVSIAWTSFAAPLVINVMLTLPNILIVNSARFAPFYPWAQPLLAMMPSGSGSGGVGGFMIPYESLMITVLGSFVVFFMAGLIYLNRKEI